MKPTLTNTIKGISDYAALLFFGHIMFDTIKFNGFGKGY